MSPLLADRFLTRRLLQDRDGVKSWHAEDLDSGQRVFLKVVADSVLEAGCRPRLEHEYHVLQMLESPHLPRLAAWGSCDEGQFLAAEWKEGETVQERLTRGPLSLEQTLSLAVGLCRGLADLHGRGGLHRDINPSNVLIGADGQGHLLDVGLVRTPLGTNPYLSPEQAGRVAAGVGPPSDLYSLGLTLGACLQGDPMAPLPATVPDGVRQILGRLVCLQPAERYQSATGLLADVLAVQLDPAGPIVLRTQDVRQTLAPPQFTGRSRELEALQEAMQRSRSVVVLTAAGGSGKTRLLDEFAEVARPHRLVVRVGLHAWASLADALVEQVQREVDKDELKSVRDRLGSWFDWLSRGGPGRSRTEGMVHFVNALSAVRGGLVLLFDDAHVKGEDVVEFLRLSQSLPAGAGRLMMVVSSRNGLPGIDSVETETMALPPLCRQAIEALTLSMLGSAPAKVLALVQDCCEGNPFLAIESLYGLSESGLLARDAGGLWQLGTRLGAESLLSSGSAGLLAHRILQLPDDVVVLLAMAALLGRTFSTGDLQAVLDQSYDVLTERLQVAQQAQILWASPDGGWVFRHDRLREQALSRLDASEKRQHHGRIAAMLAATQPQRSEEIAWHYSQSDTPALARDHALQAGDHARRHGAFHSAVDCYRIALSACGPRDAEAEVQSLTGLAESLQRRGAYGEAESTLLQAIERVRSDSVEAARLHTLRAQIAGQQGNKTKVLQCLRQALGVLGRKLPRDGMALKLSLAREVIHQWLHAINPHYRPAASPAVVREAEILAANIEMTASNTSPWLGMYFMFRALNVLERGPATPAVALLLAQHSCMATYMPALKPRSLRYARRSIDMADHCAQPVERARVQARAMNPYMLTGDLHRSLQLNLEAEPVLEAGGPVWELHIVRFHIATLQYFLGRLPASEAAARALFNEALLRKDSTIIGVALHAWARSSLGRVPEQAFERTRALMTVRTSLGWIEWAEARCIVLYYQGRYQEAADMVEADWARHPKDQFHAGQIPTWLSACYRKLAAACRPEDAVRREGWYRKARRYGRQAVGLGRAYVMYLPHALREAGLLAASLGHVHRSRRLMDESLTVSARFGMGYEHALSSVAWGQVGQYHGWDDADRVLQGGERDRRELEAGVSPQPETEPDRFDSMIEAGQLLASSLTVESVFDTLHAVALRLLRPETVVVLAGDPVTVVRGPKGQGWRVSVPLLQDGVLCVPVLRNGVACAWLYATGAMLGEEEVRLATFITRLAGAALENVQALRDTPSMSMRSVAGREREYRILYDGIGVSLVLLDRDRQVVGYNRLAAETLGAGLGQSDVGWVHPEDRPSEQALFDRLVAGQIEQYRVDVRCTARNSGWVQMAVSRLPEEGLFVRAISDISHRRLRQVALFQEADRHSVAASVHAVVSVPVSDLSSTITAWRDAPPEEDALRCETGRLQSLLLDLGHLMFQLRTPAFKETGLVLAIQQCVREFQRALDAVALTVEVDAELGRVEGLAAGCVYRIVLECLEAVRRSAMARTLTLRLRCRAGTVRGTIVVEGGPAPRVPRATRGLVELIGGRVEDLRSSAGIALILPVSRPLWDH